MICDLNTGMECPGAVQEVQCAPEVCKQEIELHLAEEFSGCIHECGAVCEDGCRHECGRRCGIDTESAETETVEVEQNWIDKLEFEMDLDGVPCFDLNEEVWDGLVTYFVG